MARWLSPSPTPLAEWLWVRPTATGAIVPTMTAAAEMDAPILNNGAVEPDVMTASADLWAPDITSTTAVGTNEPFGTAGMQNPVVKVAETAPHLALAGGMEVPTVWKTVVSYPKTPILKLTGKVPTIQNGKGVFPTGVSFALTGRVPTIINGTATTVQPGGASLTLTGSVPAKPGGIPVFPGGGSLALAPAVPVLNTAPAALYAFTGAGLNTTSSSTSFTQAVLGPDPALVVFLNIGGGGAYTGMTRTVTVGPSAIAAVPMTSLGVVAYSADNTHFLEAFVLLAPPGGTQGVFVTLSHGAVLEANGVLYNNVAGYGALQTNSSTTGTAMSLLDVPSRAGQRVVNCWGLRCNNNTITGYNQTQRWQSVKSASVNPLMMGDAIGDVNGVDFAANISTSPNAQGWGAMALPLLPAI